MSARPEVADIFRRHGEQYRQASNGHLGRVTRRTMNAIELCRTAALGAHVEGCRSCEAIHSVLQFQGQACREWLAARQNEILRVPYFYVVFTLPAQIAVIAFQNKAAVYTILFNAASETMRMIAADTKHLGAQIGLVAVLHSLGQNGTIRTSTAFSATSPNWRCPPRTIASMPRSVASNRRQRPSRRQARSVPQAAGRSAAGGL